jgi:C-5 cytosine-specific DNA methylase
VRLLDLFAGAGGAARGYQLAGFHVTGIDINPQPRYAGDEFIQGDALEYLATADLSGFDAIHASPPCQAYANVTAWRGQQSDHPDLVAATRDALNATGLPWVIENVPEAPIRPDLLLCGSQFGLRVRRHRAFETSPRLFSLIAPCRHRDLLPFMHKGVRSPTPWVATG